MFYNRRRGSERLKIEKKSIQNRCKIKARKKGAERSQNKQKGSQNGFWNQSKIAKRGQRGANGNQKGEKGRKKGMPKTKPKKGGKMDAKRFGPAECAWPPQSAIMALPGLTRPILPKVQHGRRPSPGRAVFNRLRAFRPASLTLQHCSTVFFFWSAFCWLHVCLYLLFVV